MTMLFKSTFYSALILLFIFSTLPVKFQAQSPEAKKRSVALLDMMDINEEDDSRVFAFEQMLIATGVPFITTPSLSEALQHGVVYFSSDIYHSSFTAAERDQIINFVSNGGILFASNIRTSTLHDLFGISGFETSRQNFRVNWNVDADPELYEYFDDDMEKETSLGRLSYPETIWSRHYDLDGAEPLAFFNNSSSQPCFVRNEYGSGVAYTMGMSIRDLILRPQLGYDYQAQRVWSNGFEPSADVIVLLFRSIYTKHVPNAVWKHTSPGNSENTVIITHDLDSRTAMDTMLPFAVTEKAQGIKANYNATVRYFNDEAMSDFYLGAETALDQIRDMGHVISSHSVGHFRDFAEFERGPSGLNMTSYRPYWDGVSTSNGFVMPEVEISKVVLENNHGVPVRTFRSGHLAFPRSLVNCLEDLGYEFDSSLSSNNILYSFPFRMKRDRSFSGEISDVYEVSMTISDVWEDHEFNGNNYQNVVQNNWLDATYRYAANYSPVTLLVHPNRNWKLEAQNMYVNNLPAYTFFASTDDYGDFWIARENTRFYSEIDSDGNVVITVHNSSMPLERWFTFGIHGQDAMGKIIVQDENGNRIDMEERATSDLDHVLAFNPSVKVAVEDVEDPREKRMKVYPNPIEAGSILRMENTGEGDTYMLTNMNGQTVAQGRLQPNVDNPIEIPQNLPHGIYVVSVIKGNSLLSSTKIVVK